MSQLRPIFLLLTSCACLATSALSSKDAAAIGGQVASILAGATTITTAQPGGTSQANQPQQTGPTTLHTTHQQPQHTCSIVNPDPDAIPAVIAHCACTPGIKKCPQYSTVGMYHSDVCRKCETDFIELSTTHSNMPQETILSACMVQSQVGVNQNGANSMDSCGVPFTSTISGTIFEWPGQAITQVDGYAGTSLIEGGTVTVPVGDSTPVGTVPPTITAISATGSPGDSTQGVWVGPMTGADLWFNISSAVESACTGTTFPLTTCAQAVIPGVPYPSAAPEDGFSPQLEYGELRINMNEVSIKDAKERSLFAYYLGMNAAASVKHMGVNACKELHTAEFHRGSRGIGPSEGPPEPLMGCFMPLEFVLIQDDGGQTEGPASLLWSQFYFTGDHGQASGLECQAVDSVVNGFLAFLMAALSMIPGPGSAAAAGVRAGVQAGTREARNLGIKAVQAGEAIKFGCKSIEDAKGAAEGDGELSSGEDLSEEHTDSLMDSLLGDGNSENPYQQDISKISDAWDTFQGILGG